MCGRLVLASDLARLARNLNVQYTITSNSESGMAINYNTKPTQNVHVLRQISNPQECRMSSLVSTDELKEQSHLVKRKREAADLVVVSDSESEDSPLLKVEKKEELAAGETILHEMKFGFHSSPKFMGHAPFNTRSDALNKRCWAPLVETNRCVVPVSGYIEWSLYDIDTVSIVKKNSTATNKQPIYVKPMKGELLYLAGLYAKEKDKNGEETWNFSILTTAGNEESDWFFLFFMREDDME